METRFTAPEGELRSNLGLLAGTVIQELRMHPFLDDELEGVPWNFRPEWLEFTVLSIVSGGYLCQYSGEEDTFGWPSWNTQPNDGFMKDGSTPVNYYVKEMPLPPPYKSNQVFVQDSWAWYRKGPEDECSVCDLIRSAATKGLWQESIELDPNLTDAELGDVMLDWLQFGEEEPEGVLAILYRALWAMAEVRERLKLYEDMLFAADGAELITPERLQEVRAGLRNDPLTLDELREMDGGLVYIKHIGSDHPDDRAWALVDEKNEVCKTVDGCKAFFLFYRKSWLAYRREPGEDCK